MVSQASTSIRGKGKVSFDPSISYSNKGRLNCNLISKDEFITDSMNRTVLKSTMNRDHPHCSDPLKALNLEENSMRSFLGNIKQSSATSLPYTNRSKSNYVTLSENISPSDSLANTNNLYIRELKNPNFLKTKVDLQMSKFENELDKSLVFDSRKIQTSSNEKKLTNTDALAFKEAQTYTNEMIQQKLSQPDAPDFTTNVMRRI